MRIVNAGSDDPYNFPESHFITKVQIDFEGLPRYVVQKGIIHRFEEGRFRKDSDYDTWQSEWLNFIQTIPEQYRLMAIQKGIEYGEKVYQYHKDFECKTPQNCVHNESWERRLAIAKPIFASLFKENNRETEIQEIEVIEQSTEFTTARQVLAIYFVLEQLQVRSNEIDRKAKAQFVQFLTGKNYKNIYDAFQDPFITKQKNFRFDDLQYIRSFFENLGLSEIVKAINNQLDKPR